MDTLGLASWLLKTVNYYLRKAVSLGSGDFKKVLADWR